jgi:hypothetical protein
MSVKAAIDALHDDAGRWDQIAGIVTSAGTAAELLDLTETTMSFAAARTGLLDTYNQLTARVAQLLQDAGETHRDLAVTLDQVAAAYEANDQRAAARFKGVWDLDD